MLDTLKMMVGRRWRPIAALFIIEVAAIIIISNLPFLPGELSFTQNQYNSIKPIVSQGAFGQLAAIFVNNFMVVIRELLPVIGPAVFALSIYETARIVEVIAIANGDGVAAALGTLFLLPHTYLELPAYAIAVTESGYLAYGIAAGFSRGWAIFVRELRFLVVSIVLTAGVLIVAAIFEVTEIQIEALALPPAPPIEGALVFLTWIPFALVFAGALSFWRRARSEAPELEAKEAEEAKRQADAILGVRDQAPPQTQGEKDGAGSPTSGEAGLLLRQEAPEHHADEHYDRARKPRDQSPGDVSADSQRHDPIDDRHPDEPSEEAQGVADQPESEQH
jgi:uncharacterized membrane protein SpoIIM required for sporulation